MTRLLVIVATFVAAVPQAGQRPNVLTMAEPVNHLDALAREPMAVEHPDGTLFVSGYSDPEPRLWKSGDGGATWARVPVGSASSGAVGNSDVDLAIAPDGTLYFATMSFDRKVGIGTRISIGVSPDVGASWNWTTLSETQGDDRPWIKIAPDGTAHAIWNDGAGVSHAVSQDRGATWTERPRIHNQGGSSHLAIGPKGEIAVRITPRSASGRTFHKGIDLIALSRHGGAKWDMVRAPGVRAWSTTFGERWVEPLAWDAAGALYSLWTNDQGLWLARTADYGRTWRTHHLVVNLNDMYYPFLTARGRGELAATWFAGHGQAVVAHVAHVTSADTARASVVHAPPFRPDVWGLTSRRSSPETRETGGEYLPVLFLRQGGLAVVSPIQNEREKRFGFSWWRVDAR